MSPGAPTDALDVLAVVVAGGRSRRMGQAKPGLVVGDRSMLEHVTATAATVAGLVVVVGAVADGVAPPRIRAVVEDPPGAGPVHAIGAGVRAATSARATAAAPASVIVLLAADLPFLTTAALGQVIDRLRGSDDDAVTAVDDDGRAQYLLGAWRTPALALALAALPTTLDASLRRLYAAARVGSCRVDGWPAPWFDCDTPAQLAQARRWNAPPGSQTGPDRGGAGRILG